ncbi:MAG: hypothetical protein IPP71_10810 [Bacteroidetes bacterium]|nr:hypothetical protein [Bacteroidota bacterium]
MHTYLSGTHIERATWNFTVNYKHFMTNQPAYVKTASYLIISFLIVAILFIGKQFLIPLVLAMLLSFLLLPISRFFENKGVHRGIAIILSLIGP